MANSVDVVLDFLRRNRFTKAEAALRGELSSRPDLNGSLQECLSIEKEEPREASTAAANARKVGAATHSGGSSKELIVKEVEVRSIGNGSGSKKGVVLDQGIGSSDLYPWDYGSIDGHTDPLSKDSDKIANNFSGLLISGRRKYWSGPMVLDKRDVAVGTEPEFFMEQRSSCIGGTGKSKVEGEPVISQMSEYRASDSYSKDNLLDNSWLKCEATSKDCSVKTMFPSSGQDASTSYGGSLGCRDDEKERRKKTESNDISEAANQQLDNVSRPFQSGKSQERSEQKFIRSFNLSLDVGNHKEEMPWLPPVKLKSEDKPVTINWEEKFDYHRLGMKPPGADNTISMGSLLDVPVGQEINLSGEKQPVGTSWLSVSQGITEDTSDLVSGFATVGDESVDYPNEYWDSDEYDDDDDVGYTRQPIEDETWFLAHEIDFPCDNEKGTGHGSAPDRLDDQSFAEEDSYFSGEQYLHTKSVEQVAALEGPITYVPSEMYGRTAENDLIAQYDGQLMDVEELNLMRAEPVWQGFVTQSDELIMLENGKVLNEYEQPKPNDLCIDDDQLGSVRSIGVGINSDVADIGSEVRESLVGGSSEGDIEYFHDHDVGTGGIRQSQPRTYKSYLFQKKMDKTKKTKQKSDKYVMALEKGFCPMGMNYRDGGFSFRPPSGTGDMSCPDSAHTLWSSKGNPVGGGDDELPISTSTDDMLATWRQKSSDSSPTKSSKNENIADAIRSRDSIVSSISSYANAEREDIKKGHFEKATDAIEEEPETGTTLEDEEAAAVQEQVRQIKSQEEEFETFDLKIVHRKNRTGFEEDKSFHVVLNSVIAGRYHVTEYLGSAAFSKAIQAHDLHTGMDVCMKIIKNNKDFFDQSLDEIKLLKFVNKNDPADKYHILRLYDYFYYREHLLIVCELLKANLYEFHKFNREAGGEVYFTMPRLQSITIQCLEALQFLHGLGLIHCDLKPENILIKSYSRCEVKVIDLGSSCFETDHLCSYVQSRSYRAPEVILGLPYDEKIDIWSLGCILAELCTGNNVLHQVFTFSQVILGIKFTC
ncbi:uncharacterized protein LOC103706777 isoform X2 [Phoenix dactylifera]|uniref:Uncharacterized protein LOC103706777 isoform X2 n=1 Tax=Phoenix dactylifera TaxID=42345 RepID=A0A8B7MTU0_PHODC|nr:uncharacterized protein LOC103706777 isoform X2 [Phoenix dactylifera]